MRDGTSGKQILLGVALYGEARDRFGKDEALALTQMAFARNCAGNGAHRAGSLRVAVGEYLTVGQQVADCGNSGNSTQPHLHLQAMDNADPSVAAGVAIAFQRFREYPRGVDEFQIRDVGVPAEGAVVEPLPSPSP